MPVHYGGYPADMDAVTAVATKHKLIVLEDCAEAHGSEWRGKRVGSLGDLGGFSHQMGKPLASGEGGSITTDNDQFADNAYSYGDLGRVRGGDQYEHYIPAGNDRMTRVPGGALLTALARLDAQTETRYQNGEYLAAELDKIGGIPALKRGDPRITKRGYYFYFMRYQPQAWGGVTRDRFVDALQAEGIHAGTAHNQPLYKNEVFEKMSFGRTGCPVICSHHPARGRLHQGALPRVRPRLRHRGGGLRQGLPHEPRSRRHGAGGDPQAQGNVDELKRG